MDASKKVGVMKRVLEMVSCREDIIGGTYMKLNQCEAKLRMSNPHSFILG